MISKNDSVNQNVLLQQSLNGNNVKEENNQINSSLNNSRVNSRTRLQWINENKENIFDSSFMSAHDECNFKTFGHSGSLDRSYSSCSQTNNLNKNKYNNNNNK